MKRKSLLFVGLITFVVMSDVVFASVANTSIKVFREVAEQLIREGAEETSEELVEATTKQLAKIAARMGDDAIVVIQRYGRSSYRLLNDLSDDAGRQLVKSIRVYGDDAIRVGQTSAGRAILRSGDDIAIRAVAKYSDVAIPVIRKYGDDCARVLTDLSPQQGRRMIQLANEEYFKPNQFDQLVGVVGEYGDRAMDFIWRNKKVLLAVGVFSAFVSNPEPYLSELTDITEVVVGPVVDGIAKGVNWNLWIGVLLVLVGVKFIFFRSKAKTIPASSVSSPSLIQSQGTDNGDESEKQS